MSRVDETRKMKSFAGKVTMKTRRNLFQQIITSPSLQGKYSMTGVAWQKPNTTWNMIVTQATWVWAVLQILRLHANHE